MVPVNYQNEILNDSMGNRRQYRVIENANGTVSFVDVTVYDREGSLFDADDVNQFAQAINLNISNITLIQNTLENGVVNGIKGNAESTYRHGNVNITAANIGTLTETQIRELISSSTGGINFILVDELPTEDISTSTIYLVPSPNSRSRNTKDEYIFIGELQYVDITSELEIYPSLNDFPVQGEENQVYVAEDIGYTYIWNSSTSQYVDTDIRVRSSSELPTNIIKDVYYLVDNKYYEARMVGDWEQIGSTAVNLSNYYTKTEIDSGSIISAEEFQAM